MALYYGNTLIAPDGDMNNVDNDWSGVNTFKSVLPLDETPLLSPEEIYQSQFLVNFNGSLRALPFDSLYGALSARLAADGFGGGGPVPFDVGDPIVLNAPIRTLSRVHQLSAVYGFPGDS